MKELLESILRNLDVLNFSQVEVFKIGEIISSNPYKLEKEFAEESIFLECLKTVINNTILITNDFSLGADSNENFQSLTTSLDPLLNQILMVEDQSRKLLQKISQKFTAVLANEIAQAVHKLKSAKNIDWIRMTQYKSQWQTLLFTSDLDQLFNEEQWQILTNKANPDRIGFLPLIPMLPPYPNNFKRYSFYCDDSVKPVNSNLLTKKPEQTDEQVEAQYEKMEL